jgi:hypothetical protein
LRPSRPGLLTHCGAGGWRTGPDSLVFQHNPLICCDAINECCNAAVRDIITALTEALKVDLLALECPRNVHTTGGTIYHFS